MNWKVIVRNAAAGTVIVIPSMWSTLSKHSLLYDIAVVLLGTLAFVVLQVGMEQTAWKSNRSLRKME